MSEDLTPVGGAPAAVTVAVPLESRRRARALLVQKAQHALPSVALLMDGLSRLRGDTAPLSLVLGTAEVGTSALVIGAFVRAVRRLKGRPRAASDGETTGEASPHHGVDWVDVLIGAMLGTEAAVHWSETGHLPRPTLLLAVAMVTLGFFHGALAAWGVRRRQLVVTARGITAPSRGHRRGELPWSEVASIEVSGHDGVVRTVQGGVRRFQLEDFDDPVRVATVLREAALRLERARRSAPAMPSDH